MACVLVLAAVVGVAGYAARRQRPRLALGLLVAAPLLAILPALALTWQSAPAPTAAAGATPAAPPAPATAPATAPADSIAPVSGARPAAAAAEFAAADQLRKDGRYAEARDAFRRVAARGGRDVAAAWAGAADCAAAAAGGDLTAGAQDIERALAADPAEPKALWLKASLELQLKHYPSAVALWSRLLEVLPRDSADRPVVEANLAEARALAAR